MNLQDLLSRLNKNRKLYKTLYSDKKTLLVIPNVQVVMADIVTNFLQGDLIGRAENVEYDLLNTFTSSLVSSPFIPLDVVQIGADKEFVISKSKGVGSNGEVLQLVGSRNEEVSLRFFSTEFMGVFKFVLKRMIEYVMDNAITVFVVDDLLSVTPYLITSYSFENRGMLKGTVVGKITLVSMANHKQLVNKPNVSRLLASLGFSATRYLTDNYKRLVANKASGFNTSNLSIDFKRAVKTLASANDFNK